MKSLLWHVSDTGEYIGKPGARVNAIEFCGLDQAVHGGGASRREPIRRRRCPGVAYTSRAGARGSGRPGC